MNVAVLGANWPLCAEAIDQTVVPATGLPSPSVKVKAAPPHSWTSIPRCRLYQACSAFGSLALKKMPPMPVTRFIEPPRSGGSEVVRESVSVKMRGPQPIAQHGHRRAVVVRAEGTSLLNRHRVAGVVLSNLVPEELVNGGQRLGGVRGDANPPPSWRLFEGVRDARLQTLE